MTHAARSGNEVLVEWMVEQGYDLEKDARKADRSPERSPHVVAAQQGDMAMLQCLQRVGYPVATKRKVFQEAVRKRCCVRALQWMVDSGFPVDWEEVEQEDVQRRPASPRVWSEQSVWIHSQFQAVVVEPSEREDLDTSEEDVSSQEFDESD